jgi:hypothetical protein
MGKGFVPPGYLRTERAILRLAQARHSERWRDAEIPLDEKKVWSGLGASLNPEFIADHLRVLTSPANDEARVRQIDRLCDYGESAGELRAALYSGTIKAEFINDSGKFEAVQKEAWSTDAGEQALMAGTAWIDEGADEVCRLILLNEAELTRLLAQDTLPSKPDAKPPSEKRAIDMLAIALKRNPDITRDEARKLLADCNVSELGFRTRVWPRARTEAGLPEKAAAGRKVRPSKSERA